MGQKKSLIVVFAVVVIVVGVVWFLKGYFAPPKMPARLSGKPMTKVDTETLEVITLGWGEWQKLGHKGRFYKNPETGKYTVVSGMRCASCGKWVPRPPVPTRDHPADPKDYVCPHCGGYVGSWNKPP